MSRLDVKYHDLNDLYKDWYFVYGKKGDHYNTYDTNNRQNYHHNTYDTDILDVSKFCAKRKNQDWYNEGWNLLVSIHSKIHNNLYQKMKDILLLVNY